MPKSRGNWIINVVLKSSPSSKQMILIKQHKTSGSVPRITILSYHYEPKDESITQNT